MTSNNDKINSLKLNLQSAIRRRLRNGKAEHSLRNLERSLTEDITLFQSECDFIIQQMQDLKEEISKVTHQISITEIVRVSEKVKIDNHLSYINAFARGFEARSARERKISDRLSKELKEKEAEQEEIERQKIAKLSEANEQKGKEAAAVESECDAIERECTVLTKRNKAIMLKLRRKLLEAEDTRRELMKKNGLVNN